MSLRFQTGICTTGKLTDKCSLSGKRTGRDRGFLMPQAALRGQEVWAASPQATSSVPVGRDHWILSWFQHRALGETELCLMCKHDLIQSPAHRQGDAAGFPVPVLPPIHSWFSTTLAQEVFRSCPHSVHSLALDITSFFVLHQRERLSMGNCGNCGWAVPSVVQLWAHVGNAVLIPNGSSWGNQRSHLQFVAFLVGPRTGPAALVNTSNVTQSTRRWTCWIHLSRKHVPFSCPSPGTWPWSCTAFYSISQIKGAGQERRSI